MVAQVSPSNIMHMSNVKDLACSPTSYSTWQPTAILFPNTIVMIGNRRSRPAAAADVDVIVAAAATTNGTTHAAAIATEVAILVTLTEACTVTAAGAKVEPQPAMRVFGLPARAAAIQ
jgi:hypothetical protein